MGSHDSVANAQSKTCSFTYFLRGEKRIKNAIGMRDSSSIVAKFNLYMPVADDVTISIFPG